MRQVRRKVCAYIGIVSICMAAGALQAQDVMINYGEDWSYFKGTEAPSIPDTAWREVGFDDGAWDVGPLGIGYGDGDDATILDDMEDNYTTVYIRHVFTATDPGSLNNLALTADYDDGFIVYLNGVEVLRQNGGDPAVDIDPPFDFTASAQHDAGTPEVFDITLEGLANLVAGSNTIAVHVLNVNITSSDLSFDMQLVGDDPTQTCPTNLTCSSEADAIDLFWTNNGPYDSITVLRDGQPLPGSPLAGTVDSASDTNPTHYFHEYEVIANIGDFSCIPLTCTTSQPVTVFVDIGDDWVYTKGDVAPSAPATAWREPGFNDAAWLVGPTGIGYGDNDDATVLDDMRMIADDPATVGVDESQPGYASFFARHTVALPDPASLDLVILEVDYDDGFIAYANGIEVARSASMGDPGTEFAFDELAASHEANGFESFVIDKGALVAGNNVIAVQVHNTTIGSTDASFLPRLVTRAEGLPDQCPEDFTCAADTDGVTLTWTNGRVYDSISVFRDGVELPGSPLAGNATSIEDTDAGDFDNTYTLIATTGAFDCPVVTCVSAIPQVDLVRSDAEWRFFRGVAAPSAPATAWRDPGFDDAAWEVGATGIGYGDGDDATVLDDMEMIDDDPATVDVDESQPGYASFYCRHEFNVGNLGDVVSLFFEIDYDDGFIAYLNGTELVRSASMGAPGQERTFDEVSDALREAGTPERFQIDEALLNAGDNLLAVEIHNGNLDSSDSSFIPRLYYSSLDIEFNNQPTARIRATPGTTVTLVGGSAQVSLDGSGSIDGEGGLQGLTYSWSKVSGPAGETIVSPTADTTDVTFSAEGAYVLELEVDDGQAQDNTDTERVTITVEGEGGGDGDFRRGDHNIDGLVNLTDAIAIFNFLFLGGEDTTCKETHDINSDNLVNLTDGIGLLNFLFLGGDPPSPPGTSCGPDDPASNFLGCDVYDANCN